MDQTAKGGSDERAPDSYDRWLVRFPGLHRAAHAHRFAIAATCLVVAAAMIPPAVASALSHPGPATSATAPTTSSPMSSLTTSSAPTAATAEATTASGPFTYTAIWDDTVVSLSEVASSAAPETTGLAGALTAFVTDDPATACLTAEAGPAVYAVTGAPNEYLVRTATPADCATADFVFTAW